MKLLQSLAHQLEQVRLQYRDRSWMDSSKALWNKQFKFHDWLGSQPKPILDATKGSSSRPPARNQRLLTLVSSPPLVLMVTVASLTSAIGYRFYNAPKLDIGRAAPQTIYAPAAATVEDAKATADKRKAARDGSISVLKLDHLATQESYKRLQERFQQGSDFRGMAGQFPFTSTAILSTQTQLYLRRAPESDWQIVLGTRTNPPASSPRSPKSTAATTPSSNPSPASTEAERQQAIGELLAYRRSADLGSYLALIETISEARLNYATALGSLSPINSPESKQQPLFDAALLDLTPAEWENTQTQTRRIAQRILAQGIHQGLPQIILSSAVQLQVKEQLPAQVAPIAAQLLLTSLEPNLIRDEDQTRIQAEQAAQEIQPVQVSIKRGEVIVQAGQTITSANFALLDYFGLSRRGLDWVGLISFGTLVGGAVTIVWVVKRRYQPQLRRRDCILVWLLALSTPILVALRLPSTNLPVVGFLVGGFYGAPLGLVVTGLLAVLLPIGMDIAWSQLLASAAGGLLCGAVAGRLRSREELALLGGAVGLLQGTLYLVLNVASGVVWYTLLGASALQGLIGLAWIIVALGSSPYLEQLFDLVTTIRLVELANPNRLLLKRLAAETPGTFQHTLFVSTLAEAAARALGCNVELVRTGTLYHDIGKMHDPQGFIENQMGGTNKHDLIDDPYKSAEIIKKHVSEGLVMARKFRLPKAVRAFIPEHQGSMLIAYFYHQAQQRAQQQAEVDGIIPEVNEADFRYDGPIPQSRETGIVMLADSCEAALRSLKDATYEEALSMINKILRARWQDNQLVDSGLTREEMSQIAEIFVQVWQQFNHQRIAYPKLTPTPQPTPVGS
ncbi:HD family phosphohydrolase [Pantanalinema rosaneae CENA516]|uniref:HD family phosphohydrolase n=1 Tax=Pantanalinema rosaneae TaxID=1620701 RepID=UPI003D6E4BBA